MKVRNFDRKNCFYLKSMRRIILQSKTGKRVLGHRIYIFLRFTLYDIGNVPTVGFFFFHFIMSMVTKIKIERNSKKHDFWRNDPLDLGDLVAFRVLSFTQWPSRHVLVRVNFGWQIILKKTIRLFFIYFVNAMIAHTQL